MGTAEWKFTAIYSAIGVAAVMAVAVILGPHVPPGTSALMQAFAAIVALGLAIYVPWRQSEDVRELKKQEDLDRANNLLHLLEGDFLILLAHVQLQSARLQGRPFEPFLTERKSDKMASLGLDIPPHFWELASDIVNADQGIIGSLRNFMVACELHNGHLSRFAEQAEGLSPEQWDETVRKISENLQVALNRGKEVWRDSASDTPFPQLEAESS